MKVLVVGASGGSGLATVKSLLSAGHEVTAFARQRTRLDGLGESARFISGNATDPTAIERAVAGQDAVIVTLGIRENALRVRLCGSANTPMHIRSIGTRNVIAAMQRHGVRRLIVQSSYGVGPTRGQLPLSYKLIFALLLKPQIEDTHAQEKETRKSGLDWTIAQPVSLTDLPFEATPYASPVGLTRSMRVSRNQVGHFMAGALGRPEFSNKTISLSAA